jgi:carbonic anhydrase
MLGKISKYLENNFIFLIFFLFVVLSSSYSFSWSEHWSYSGYGSPENWENLSPEYKICGTGLEQSPVDIVGVSPVELSQVEINYCYTGSRIVNNGHSLQVNHDEGSFIVVDGERFDLLQFHFHTPSENTINGYYSSMEMHLVHTNVFSDLLVIAVMINQGAMNPNYESICPFLPSTEDGEHRLPSILNPEILLPEERDAYHFLGSLTTPPCTEGVKWVVMMEPVELSSS